MEIPDLLLEIYGRIPPLARAAVTGLDSAQLCDSPTPGTNSIGWLVWHTARVQDDHVADIFDAHQLWATGDWAARFALEPDPSNIGYGHSAEDAHAVKPESPDVLVEYLDAVQARTLAWLGTLTAADLDMIVDRRWDPPVSMGVRLVSVADDSLQHLGQAAYLRGLMAI